MLERTLRAGSPTKYRSSGADNGNSCQDLEEFVATPGKIERDMAEQIESTDQRKCQGDRGRDNPLISGDDDGRRHRHTDLREHRASCESLADDLEEETTGKLAQSRRRERIPETDWMMQIAGK